MKIKISPGYPRGSVSAPPSKSYAHRMIICAALSDGESIIKGVAENEDVLATLDCARALGARCTLSGDTLTVVGAVAKSGGASRSSESDFAVKFPCRESGSTMRFFIPVSLVLGERAEFSGTKRLIERGVGVYEKLFSEKKILCQNNGERISFSGKLTSGEYILPGNVSSQFVSGLLFALPLLSGDSIIKVLPPVESRGYIDITLDTLCKFGVEITEKEPNVFFVRGSQRFQSGDMTVEGDWSNGAALLALGKMMSVTDICATGDGFRYFMSDVDSGKTANPVLTVGDGEIKVLGLKPDSLQGDKICVQLFEKLRTSGAEIDISGCPDLGPVLFAVAASMCGGKFVGTRRLRIKESDRAQAMAAELKKFGISVTVEENAVTVHKGELKAPGFPCFSHNDHRIVMALSILGALVGCEIESAEAITKSYPDFFVALTSLGLKVETENEA